MEPMLTSADPELKACNVISFCSLLSGQKNFVRKAKNSTAEDAENSRGERREKPRAFNRKERKGRKERRGAENDE